MIHGLYMLIPPPVLENARTQSQHVEIKYSCY